MLQLCRSWTMGLTDITQTVARSPGRCNPDRPIANEVRESFATLAITWPQEPMPRPVTGYNSMGAWKAYDVVKLAFALTS